MANAIGILGRQLREIWGHFGINQKVSTIFGLILVLGVIGGLLLWSARPSYRLLYSGMSLKDASTALEKLEDEHISVKLKDSGRALYVPAHDVYRGRLLLASEGLPEDTGTGFELFEEPKFGLTDFAQTVNYQRALQGELERTISSMKGIHSCRVMLVLPKEKLFASREKKEASASILLNMASDTPPAQGQVSSITQFVAAGVPGLKATAITVTDQHGRMLSRSTSDSEDGIQATGDQLEIQEKLESSLARKAQDMLDQALGPGRSIVRVSAMLDFSALESRKETLDAEGRVAVSETTSTEETKDPQSNSGGRVGIMANVAVANPSNVNVEQGVNSTKKEDITTEYQVPSGYEHVVRKGISIKNISVAVCVAQGKEPRSPEAIKSIENMVRSAVGFTESAERTDVIQVEEMNFPAPAEAPPISWWLKLPVSLGVMGKGVGAVILLIFILIASRRTISRLSIETTDVGVPIGALPSRGMPQTGPRPTGNTAQTEPDIDYVSRLAEQDPNAVAAWIMNTTRSVE